MDGYILVLLALVLVGCAEGVVPATPVAVATPVTLDVDATEAAQPSEPASEPEGPDLTGPNDEPTDMGASPLAAAAPGPADVARFVRSHAVPGATSVEHVAIDLDRDGISEVVLTGIVGAGAVVEVAWWAEDAYRVMAGAEAGRGRVVAAVRAADITKDGQTELVVEVEGGAARSMALWSVTRRGRLTPLRAIGGCHAGSHVYGVVGARLVDTGPGLPLAVVASCDDSPLPIADWSEQRWEWRTGAYRLVTQTVPPPVDPSPVDAEGRADA